MTDRYHTLTVVLADDVREDDAGPLMAAIGQLRGVLTVTGHVTDLTAHMAHERARTEMRAKAYDALKDLTR